MDSKEYFELLLKNIDNVHKSVEKLDDKIEKVEEKHASIEKTLIRNTASLEEHIRRTDILESKFDNFEDTQTNHMKVDEADHKDLSIRLEALEAPRKAFKLLRNYVVGAGVLSGAIWSILKLLGKV